MQPPSQEAAGRLFGAVACDLGGRLATLLSIDVVVDPPHAAALIDTARASRSCPHRPFSLLFVRFLFTFMR
jgi:hypothetical protein